MPTPSTIWTGMESLALEPVDELFGEADRLGHPVGTAREHPANGRGQRDPVAHRHVERANVVARSEDGADPFALEHQGGPVAAGRARAAPAGPGPGGATTAMPPKIVRPSGEKAQSAPATSRTARGPSPTRSRRLTALWICRAFGAGEAQRGGGT